MFAVTQSRANAYRLVVCSLLLTIAALGAWAGSKAIEPADIAAPFRCDDYKPLPPTGSGVVRPVGNQTELVAALKVAEPGDTVNLASGIYDELRFRPDYGHRSGSSGNPIVIQAAVGASPVVDRGDGTVSDRWAVVVQNIEHVTVRGLEIRHGIHGVEASGVQNIVFEYNDIHDTALAGVLIDGYGDEINPRPSSNVTVRCNTIHNTGRSEPEYGEGIYVGSGKTGVVDKTNNVTIEGNEIYATGNEAVDVKRHVTNVTIRYNEIHDVSPFYGGAISLGLNKNSWGPANYLVEHNRIWAVKSGLYYAQAIAIGHGPTIIRHNVIWDIESTDSDTWLWTAPIQIHGDDNGADWAYGFGNPAATEVEITENTVIGCTQACISSHTDPGETEPSLTVAYNIVDQPSDGAAVSTTDIVVALDDLIGPASGDADSGNGPGSGLLLKSIPTASSTTSPPPKMDEAETSTTLPSQSPSTSADQISSTTTSESEKPSSSTVASSTPIPSELAAVADPPAEPKTDVVADEQQSAAAVPAGDTTTSNPRQVAAEDVDEQAASNSANKHPRWMRVKWIAAASRDRSQQQGKKGSNRLLGAEAEIQPTTTTTIAPRTATQTSTDG